MATSLESLSNEELRNRLLQLGQRVGPVTSTTRDVYLKKLKALQSGRRSNDRHLSGFSSDESDADDRSFGGNGTWTRSPLSSKTTSSSITSARATEYTDSVISSREPLGGKSTKAFNTSLNAPFRRSDGDEDMRSRRSLDSGLCRPSINGVGQCNYQSPQRNQNDRMREFGWTGSNDRADYYTTRDAYRNDSLYSGGGSTYVNRGLVDVNLTPTSTNPVQRKINSSQLFSKTPSSEGSFAQSTFSPKSKITSGHPASKWQLVPMVLIALGIGFFLLLGFMYWNVSSSQGDARNNFLVCQDKEEIDFAECIPQTSDYWVRNLMKQLVNIISIRSGDFECGYDETRNVSIREYDGLIDSQMKSHFGKVWPGVKNITLALFIHNPHWAIRLYDSDDKPTEDTSSVKYLLSDKSQMSVWCRFKLSAVRVMSVLISILAVVVTVVLGFAGFKWQRKRQEEEMKEVVKLVERIIDKVKQQADTNLLHPEIPPYVAIAHVRDSLIPLHERYNKQQIWEKAVKFINTQESRIRTEDQKIEAEDFVVWRWVSPSVDIAKVWQGQAFGEHGSKAQNYPPSLATCLKIRNMFDADVEYGEDWHVSIEDAILEKCGVDHGILHVAVDRASKDGCVYVRCRDLESAGRAFKALHGWWFDGKLVTVKYLREQRYFERFPEAVDACKPVKPSNTNQTSLSRPFHSSIIETS